MRINISDNEALMLERLIGNQLRVLGNAKLYIQQQTLLTSDAKATMAQAVMLTDIARDTAVLSELAKKLEPLLQEALFGEHKRKQQATTAAASAPPADRRP